MSQNLNEKDCEKILYDTKEYYSTSVGGIEDIKKYNLKRKQRKNNKN